MPHVDLEAATYVEIGKRMSRLRRVLGLTQVEMGEQLGMTGPRWANYETGTSRIPPEEAIKLVQMFGITLDWLYYGNRAMMPLHLIGKIDAIQDEPPKRRSRNKTH